MYYLVIQKHYEQVVEATSVADIRLKERGGSLVATVELSIKIIDQIKELKVNRLPSNDLNDYDLSVSTINQLKAAKITTVDKLLSIIFDTTHLPSGLTVLRQKYNMSLRATNELADFMSKTKLPCTT